MDQSDASRTSWADEFDEATVKGYSAIDESADIEEECNMAKIAEINDDFAAQVQDFLQRKSVYTKKLAAYRIAMSKYMAAKALLDKKEAELCGRKALMEARERGDVVTSSWPSLSSNESPQSAIATSKPRVESFTIKGPGPWGPGNYVDSRYGRDAMPAYDCHSADEWDWYYGLAKTTKPEIIAKYKTGTDTFAQLYQKLSLFRQQWCDELKENKRAIDSTWSSFWGQQHLLYSRANEQSMRRAGAWVKQVHEWSRSVAFLHVNSFTL